MFFKQIKGKEKKSSSPSFKKTIFKKKIYFLFLGFPYLPISKSAKGDRMGKGKGENKEYYYNCGAGKILLLISIQNLFVLKYAAYKLKNILIKNCVIYLYINNFLSLKFF